MQKAGKVVSNDWSREALLKGDILADIAGSHRLVEEEACLRGRWRAENYADHA